MKPSKALKPAPQAATILDALDDPGLFAGMFDAPSWTPWKAFLRTLWVLPLGDSDLALFRHHTGRERPPTKPSRYASLVCGRRGGKSRILGLIAAYLATVPDHAKFLVPGETGVIAVIAADRRQARIILSYIAGTLRAAPMLAGMIVEELAESIRLDNGILVEVHTASIGAPRGRTFIAVLCDESAFWPSGDSANPDVEVRRPSPLADPAGELARRGWLRGACAELRGLSFCGYAAR